MPDVAPVSGPGALARRTDLGTGQPIRIPTGLTYGKSKQLEQMQQAIHLPTGGPANPGPVPVGGGNDSNTPVQPIPPNILELLSHKTDRLGEPVTAPSGAGTTQIPLNTVIAALENVIANSSSVPAAVMRLYQNIRVEAAAQGGATVL